MVVGSQGQDGRILSSLLRTKGYAVYGVSRQSGTDISDARGVLDLMRDVMPDEVYYLPAIHRASEEPETPDIAVFQSSYSIHCTGLVHFLEAIRTTNSRSRLFYAGSSLVFGEPDSPIQDETTPFSPTTVYGITKAAGVWTCRYYRRRYGTFVSVGLLYNHESELRPASYISQRIVTHAAAIQRGELSELVIGDLDAVVDWGYAPDYCEAMHQTLALESPDDFIIASGQARSVREFVEVAFRLLDLDWTAFVREDPSWTRKEPSVRVGNPKKLAARTGWIRRTSFDEMIATMLAAKGARISVSQPKPQ